MRNPDYIFDMLTKRIVLFTFLLLASISSLTGQVGTWDYLHLPPYTSYFNNNSSLRELEMVDDGGGIFMGWEIDAVSGQAEIISMRMSRNGSVEWINRLPGQGGYFWTSTRIDSNRVAFVTREGFAWILNESGQVLHQDTLPLLAFQRYAGLSYSPTHGLALTAENAPNFQGHLQFIRLDTNLNILLDTTYSPVIDSFDVSDHLLLQDGNYLLVGDRNSTARAVKVSPNGNIIWNKNVSPPKWPTFPHVVEFGNGELFVLFNSVASNNTLRETHMTRLNPQGDTLWTRFLVDSLRMMEAIQSGPDRITFICEQVNGIDQAGYLVQADTAGNVIWERRLELGSTPFWVNDLGMNDKGYLLAGHTNSNPQLGLIVQLDSNGYFENNIANGTLYFDSLSNCSIDQGEPGYPYLIVQADPGPSYTIANGAGEYSMALDSGMYWLSIPNLPPLWQLNCPSNPDSNLVVFPSVLDTIDNVDFALEAAISCPLLITDIGTAILRPCSSSTYNLSVTNMGTASAPNAYVDLYVDSLLTVDSVSCPYTVLGPDSFRIQIGSLPVFGSANCLIHVSVDCNPVAISGLAACVEAHAYPDSICEPAHPNWDSSSIQVRGLCIPGDTIEFTISNVGTQNMSSPTGILIAEDDILRQSFNVQLQTGMDTVVKIEGNGSTWTCIADQVPFHPGLSLPRATVEACGTDSFGNFSTGFVTTLAEDDQDPYLSIHCLEITNAYDPNDKRGFPGGTGPDHLILDSDALDYHIRFQNTGTDTAFNIVVRDQLPPELDLGSLQLGAASHPFTFKILPDRTLEWTFSSILLPDSNVNEPGSHGYLKFRIQQNPGNPAGTRIENAAAIYFDFNPPIITNTAFHTIADSLPDLVYLPIEVLEGGPKVLAYPNPFDGAVRFRFPPGHQIATRVEIYDLNGRLVGRVESEAAELLTFPRRGLPSGMYIYRSFSMNKLLQTGKLIAK